MKLLYSPTSPYARKVRIVAIEKGLADRIETIGVDVLGKPDMVRGDNPLAKIPTLVLDDGNALFDSPVICEYLDGLAPTPKLIPEGAARFEALKRQALADGAMDAAFNLVMERRRPEAQRSQEWTTRWRNAITHALAALDAEVSENAPFDLGWIAALCARDYVEFRLSDLGLAGRTPKLSTWRATLADRPSVTISNPPAG
jgi:glutathione S-transferase